MRRWVVGAAVVSVVAIATIVLALRSAGRWIDANREWITGRLSETVGRSVSFGEVGVSFLPRLGVRVADVRVGDDPAWSTEPFVVADAAAVEVAVLSALRGRVVVRRVTLEAPVVTVIRSPEGMNVGTLGGRPRRPAGRDRSGPRAAPAAAEAGPRTPSIVIDRGSIRDGRVRLVDRRGGRERVVEISDVDASIAGVAPDRAATVEGQAAILGATRRNASLAGSIGPVDPGALAETPIDVRIEAEDVAVARLREAIPEVAKTIPEPLGIDGPLDLAATVAGTAVAPRFEARIDATRARVTWAEWFAKPAGVTLGVAGAGQRIGRGARFERLAVELADLRASASGDASPERVAMRLEAAPAALEPLAALLPALGSRRVGGALGLRVDATGPVTDGRTPALTGTVLVRDLSVASDDPPLSLEDFTQTIRLEGNRAVLPRTRFTVNGEPVEASGRLEGFGTPVLALADLDLGIFGGSVRGRAAVDRSTPARPRLSTALRLEAIDVAAAARTRSPAVARSVRGRLGGAVRLAGRGGAGGALRDTLVGDGRLAIEEGALRGMNLADAVLAGVAKVPGVRLLASPALRARYPRVFGGEDSAFEELSAVWRLADGVLRFEPVTLEARDYRIEGRGTLTMEGRVSATGTLALSPALSDDLLGSKEWAALARSGDGRLAIPFAVEGTWPRVRVAPDPSGLVRAVPGAGIVEKGVERLLDGLFNR